MYLAGHWVSADLGVMAVLGLTMAVVSVLGAYVVRAALARSRRVDLAAADSREAEPPQREAAGPSGPEPVLLGRAPAGVAGRGTGGRHREGA